MASNYFTISPTGGTGDGSVLVSPVSVNDSSEDREAVVTIGNGVNISQNVVIKQWGIPSIELVGGGTEPISAPANGDTYQFKVKTHYDIQFRNKPTWITIDDGQGNYVTAATASVANGRTYNFNVSANGTNNTRSTSGFGLYFTVGGVLQTPYDEISISQAQGASDYINVISGSSLDWDSTNAKSITVDANVTYDVVNSNPTDFTVAGGNGYITVRANATNTGSTQKTTTISFVSTKASFPYTATCVVTQFREPTLTTMDGSTVEPSGETKYMWVESDYSWWISPLVSPDNVASYISMPSKTADVAMDPTPTTGAQYSLIWTANDMGGIRSDNLHIGYIKADGSTSGVSSSVIEYRQGRYVEDGITVSPTRIPPTQGEYVSSGGGVYVVEVTTERRWHLNDSPMYASVVPSSGVGSSSVTITVFPTDLTRYRNESYTFATVDAPITSATVSMFQEAAEEPKYISVTPTGRTISSGGSASLNNNFVVSANTNWSITYKPDWAIFRTSPIGGTVVTGGTSGETTIYISCSSNSGSERSDVVWFLPLGAGVATTSVTLTQIGAYSHSVEPVHTITTTGSTTIPATGGSVVLNIVSTNSGGTADVWWFQPAKPDYITGATPFYPTQNQRHSGGSDVTIVLSWAANDSASTRVFDNLYMLGNWGAVKAPSFTQEAAEEPVTPSITFDSNPFNVSTTGVVAGQNVAMSSNVPWTAESDNDSSSWFSVESTAGTAGNTNFVFDISNANTGASRTAYVYFKYNGNTVATLTINQAGAVAPTDYLYFSPSAMSTTSASTNALNPPTTNIVSSGDWVVVGKPYWFNLRQGLITVVTGGTSGTTEANVYADENNNISQRIGTFAVSGNGMSAYYTVTQEPRKDDDTGCLSTSLSSDELVFESPYGSQMFEFHNDTDSVCTISFTNDGTWIMLTDDDDNLVSSIPAGWRGLLWVTVPNDSIERVSTIVFTTGRKSLGILVHKY